jgi:hypothetical protein
VTGEVILWVSRPVEILDDVRVSLGAIEAGLAQFGKGSKLKGCVPDGDALDLSDQFANFLVADNRSFTERGLWSPTGGGLCFAARAGFLAACGA